MTSIPTADAMRAIAERPGREIVTAESVDLVGGIVSSIERT